MRCATGTPATGAHINAHTKAHIIFPRTSVTSEMARTPFCQLRTSFWLVAHTIWRAAQAILPWGAHHFACCLSPAVCRGACLGRVTASQKQARGSPRPPALWPLLSIGARGHFWAEKWPGGHGRAAGMTPTDGPRRTCKLCRAPAFSGSSSRMSSEACSAAGRSLPCSSKQ